ncbi:valine--tRNA ligase [Longimicrobium sp.]|uniref:valine--tRNA ligase n=1 Tax=Longimicrobium sp. TaxID=2029185 RepID=UPI002E3355FF|nr:valine--tRNA ligase [Longimicrobium sp.]HEX6037206.1 valine--tRNA ligase [Longimicrobium sp.]
MAEPLPPQYSPQENEDSLYRWWEEQGYFRADANSDRAPYVIVIPPPNVTAVLHMGHGLNNSIQDTLIRQRRMQGREALWLPGTDHAGIATQNVVERLLAKEGRTRYDLGREAFVERVWEFVDETGGKILEQLRAIGCSLDWSRTRFTLDPALSTAVREVFVRLHEKGLVYRGHRIINWCPRCLTALSDEESEGEETQGKLYHLRYPLAEGVDAPGLPRLPDGRPYLVVATTRPETMLGDTGVAVHPDDARFAALVGREIDLPLTGRRIPVVADTYVDPEFGSGAVKMTPAHDPNDFDVAQRTGLPALNVMTPDAMMNDEAPEAFRGMDRFEARRAVVHAFEELGLLERVEEHTHAVPHCYRCDTVVEPRLSEQWFVKMKPLAEPALQVWRDGELRFHPERFGKIYEHWMENIRDWCISRQLWWGHRIPVWYCQAEGCGETIVAREDPTSCPKCGGGSLEQDPDVLDTWFSSWLWPFSTLGWPEETEDLRAFYPGHTLVTAPEILFFWVARMVMAGMEFRGQIPFTDVYFTGTVRDHIGRKMSKSLGNGIDPLVVKERFGADALRYTVISGSGAATDQFLNYENLEETFGPGRNFANKLWNAGRFALMNLGDDPRIPVDEVRADLEPMDRWILSRMTRAVREVTDAFERFRLQDCAIRAYEFFWGELADWYLELVKPRLRGDMGDASRRAAQATLAEALDTALRLLHPVMPFITETVWQKLPRAAGAGDALMVARWPEPRADWEDEAAERAIAELQEVIGVVRGIRSEYGIQPAARVPVRIAGSDEAVATMEASRRALRDLARVEELSFGGANGEIGASAVLRSGTEVFIPLAGVIDLDRERARLREEITRIDGQIAGGEKKLSNESFVARAPENVVAYERDKLASFREQRGKLADKLAALEGAA